jgi:hypothetical protein
VEPLQPSARQKTEGLRYQKTGQADLQLLRRPAPIEPNLNRFVSGGVIDPNQASCDRIRAEQKGKRILAEAEDRTPGEEIENEGLSTLFQQNLQIQEATDVMVTGLISNEEDPIDLITTQPHPAETNWYLLDPPQGHNAGTKNE